MRIARLLIVSLAAMMFIIIFSWNAQAAVGEDNANLVNIHEGAGALSPAFSPSITEYWVKMPSAAEGYFTAATPSDSGATMQYSMNDADWKNIPTNTSTGNLGTFRGDNTFLIKVTATDSTTTKTYTIHVYYPTTDDANLSDLRSSETTLSPTFQSSTTNYTANVPYATSSLTIIGVLDDSAASLKINATTASSGVAYGPISLNVGTNTITVLTESFNATVQKTYTITAARAAPSTNADLSAIAVSGNTLSPPFQSNQTVYTLSDVSNATSQMTVTPTVADSTATVQVRVNGGSFATVSSGSASGPLTLNVGSNSIEVKVTAQDGTTTNAYTMTVKRKSDDATLSGLIVGSLSLNEPFASSMLAYTMVDVANATNTLMVTPTLTDAANAFVRVRVNGGNYTEVTSGNGINVPLMVGSNTIEVQVMAEDTSISKLYKITVQRKSNDAMLSGLTVSSGSLNFSTEVTSYSLTVSQSIQALTVKPTLSTGNTFAAIQIRINGGTYLTVQSGIESLALPLQSGKQNVIDVLVTAQDLTNRIYTIKVNQSGTPVLNNLLIEGMQAKLTFSEPLMLSVTDATYYTINNVTRNVALSVTEVLFTAGSPEMRLTLSGLILPGDELKFQMKAGAVTSFIGETNVVVNQTISFGVPLHQMQQRLTDLDTDHNGIHINEILAYMSTTTFGRNDLNGDGQFDREDVQLVLKQIGTKVIPSP